MWRRQSEFESAHGPEGTAPGAREPRDADATAAPAATATPDAGAESARNTEGGGNAEGGARAESVREAIIEQLKTVFDPEIPVNIYELGLIYDVSVADDGKASIRMTLTTPMCPAAEELPPEVETKARGVPGVTSVELDLVWDPPWGPERMSEAARLDLGMV